MSESTGKSKIGVTGLAVMGANLARNAARKGFGVALYNRHGERTDKLMEEFGQEGRFTPTKDIAGFVAALGWGVLGLVPSPILGRDGNTEFLLAARR